MMNKKSLLAAVAVFLMIALCIVSAVHGEDAFTIRRIGNINPYGENSFSVQSSLNGIMTIKVHDSVCTYRTMIQEIQKGENIIKWDGCGYNREKLYEKTYTITAELKTDSGETYTQSFNTPIEFPFQCLQYVLPSSDFLYLDNMKEWFVEYRTVTDGKICMEFVSEDGSESETYILSAKGGKIARKEFADFAGKRILKPGNYKVFVYEKSKSDEKYSFDLHIINSSPVNDPVQITGEIMPERSMTDNEIWELMMKPSVVVDIDFFKHQNIYELPDENSAALGTLHGQTQGVKVISINEEWAHIGAWNHEDASYTEGWVPVGCLKTVYPAKEYGILVDKQKQTMTIYHNGKVIDQLIVSTGKSEKNRLYQETSAGCFLTGYHRVNFSMNGKKYDYVIQYDGGNLLHQTPYDWGNQKKDFSMGRAYLGAKASHACIRIQPEPGEGGLNAFWLFTHIPYHTRIIILDDPEEREKTVSKLSRGKNADAAYDMLQYTESIEEAVQSPDVVITFGGTVFSGGIKAKQSKNSLSSMISENRQSQILSELTGIFETDDMTCVNLCCPLSDPAEAVSDNKKIRTAMIGSEKILEKQSVEVVQMISEGICESGEKAVGKTAEAIGKYSTVHERNTNVTMELKGHVFGLAACSEKEYMQDPGVIDQRITALKNQHCERILISFYWDHIETKEHTIVQEAMAHRAVRAGADLIIGNYPDLVQGIDYIEGIPVIYSLGSLVDGNTSGKAQIQQGFLIRAVFSFEELSKPVSLTVIPVISSENSQTENCPTANISKEDTRKAIRNIWLDTADQILEKIKIFIPDQS